MKKLFNKIKLFFIIKYNEYILNKELDSNINIWFNEDIHRLQQEDVLKLYSNGLSLVQDRLEQQLGFKSAINYQLREYLKINKDLDILLLSRDESKDAKILRETLESIISYKDKDCKTQKEIDEMFDKKINNYNDYLKQKKLRELLRGIRKARAAGELHLLRQLTDEYKELYNGRTIN